MTQRTIGIKYGIWNMKMLRRWATAISFSPFIKTTLIAVRWDEASVAVASVPGVLECLSVRLKRRHARRRFSDQTDSSGSEE